MPQNILHGPCANCGGGTDEILLKSKTVNYTCVKNTRNGPKVEHGIRSLALCSACFPVITTVDTRVTGKDI